MHFNPLGGHFESQGHCDHKFDLFIKVPSIPIAGQKQYPETPSH